MNSFEHSTINWRTEAAKIAEIKRHFNNLGELVTKMNKSEAPSPRQQQAIREVTPMVEELASYITMTIYHLGENPDRLNLHFVPGVRGSKRRIGFWYCAVAE
jgi:hypothetical protein